MNDNAGIDRCETEITAAGRVLVTGGAGFIGSHVVEALLKVGMRVTVLDDFSTGLRENLPAPSEALRVVQGAILDRVALSRALDEVVAVIHLAAVASVRRSFEDRPGTHKINYAGSELLLDACSEAGVRRVLYASSAAVYGDYACAVSEKIPPRPLSPYAEDKLAVERLLDQRSQNGGAAFTAFRFFNVYGPRQNPASDYAGVIELFLRQVRRDEPLTIFGDGLQTRDFVYVSDVAGIVVDSLLRGWGIGSIVNVGRGSGISLLELVNAIECATRKRAEIHRAAARVGDICYSVSDVALLYRLSGMRAETDLAAGLRMMLRE
ncbi:MAG: NAD-dependent epimerase/dehydratase family protein [Pseudomonadota bacterium]